MVLQLSFERDSFSRMTFVKCNVIGNNALKQTISQYMAFQNTADHEYNPETIFLSCVCIIIQIVGTLLFPLL